MGERRYGRFQVPLDLIEQHPAAIRAVMGEVIVLRAEALIAAHAIEYEAVCPDFDIVAHGEAMPTYDVIFEADTHKVVWVKQG